MVELGLSRDIRIQFSDRNVVPGSTKYVDPGTCRLYFAKGRQPRVGVRITVSLIFVPEPESRCFINPLKIIICSRLTWNWITQHNL